MHTCMHCKYFNILPIEHTVLYNYMYYHIHFEAKRSLALAIFFFHYKIDDFLIGGRSKPLNIKLKHDIESKSNLFK